MTKTKKGQFIELEFTGLHNGKVFDSNIEEDLKKVNENAKAEKMIIVIGEGMVVAGLDKALEDKELNKEYEIHLTHMEAFGERKRDLVKTLPLSVFSSQKVNPYPGATFFLDNFLVRVITVSGARVITDFNNPLAGKDLDYKFKITRIVDNDRERAESLFRFFFRMIPEFEITDKIIVKGEKPLEYAVNIYNDKFKNLLGKEIIFEEVKKKQEKEAKDKEKPLEKASNS